MLKLFFLSPSTKHCVLDQEQRYVITVGLVGATFCHFYFLFVLLAGSRQTACLLAADCGPDWRLFRPCTDLRHPQAERVDIWPIKNIFETHSATDIFLVFVNCEGNNYSIAKLLHDNKFKSYKIFNGNTYVFLVSISVTG
jgi:hypothetical protein